MTEQDHVITDGPENEYRIFGPPGCGKTSYLSAQVEQAWASGREVLVCSLTKTAAAEVISRDVPIPSDSVGTLHSHCFRSLDHPKIAEDPTMIQEWNEEYPQWRINVRERTRSIDEDNLDPIGDSPGDNLMGRHQIHRARQDIHRMPPDVRDFADAWTAWKRDRGIMDFTDLIEACLETVAEAPDSPNIMFVDEAQDLDYLEMALIRKWGRAAGYLVIVGDPDQCQPAGTMVQTKDGPVPIEDLNPAQHQILTWNRHSQAILGKTKTFPFRKIQRPYRGPVLTLHTDRNQSTCTPDHRWVIKWSNKTTDTCVVYLMRQGPKWRIGWCQLFNVEGSFHLGQRARLEEADAAWVLTVTHDRQEASISESIVAAKYGLPTATFAGKSNHLSQEQLARIWDGLDQEEQATRALQCLNHHGRDPRFPMWEQGNVKKRGLTRVQEIRACNLLPNIMAVPEYANSKLTRWTTIQTITQEDLDGTVYSLEVDPHETYIADGLVTHNCLYRWRGSDPRAFSTPRIHPDQRRILAQSYRVPRKVHQRAVQWIEQVTGRDPVEYYPRDEEGEVRHLAATYKYPEPALADAEQYLAQGKRVMFLTTCAYMLTPLVQALRKQGIPFHNPHRRSNGAWNPLQKRKNSINAADRLLSWLSLSESGGWTADAARQWSSGLQAEEVLQRGGRTRVKHLADNDEDGLSWDVIYENFTEEAISAGLAGDLTWYRDHLVKDKKAGAEFPLTVVRQHGPERLKEPPLLTPGTVHSVKGAEADVVYLFPDLSKAGRSEWAGAPDLKASVHRLFYVAMTRARESLIICQAADTEWPVNL